MPITLQTDKPIAYDSPDHLYPFGTANDNSTDPIFNEALFALIPPRDVRLLDIGCSGGGFVKSILDVGGFAVGIEGSDYSQKRRRAEWATIPDHLFTADATTPFQVFEDGRPAKFNVITAWEFLEHIADEDLDGVFENIRRHLAPQGIVIVSVCPFTCLHNGAREGEGIDLHLTTQPESWWRTRLDDFGFRLFDDLKGCFTNYVRGWPHEPDSPVLLFTTPQARQIPKIFHQVWLGDKSFPAEAQAYQETWRRLHPDWEWRLWTEADLGGFESRWALTNAAHLSQRSDIIRYEVLRRFGGVYLDTDVECRRNIEPLLQGVTAFAGRERGDILCGAVLGGIAGHPLFDALVRGLPESMRSHTLCIEQAGPHYLSRITYGIPEVTIFAPEIFYPYSWEETHRQNEVFSDAYAVHHWRGSWKAGGEGRVVPVPILAAETPRTPLTPQAETLLWRGRALRAFPPGRHTEFQTVPARVSVCVSALGGTTQLGRCTDSILGQEYDDFQVVLVADTPETFAVAAGVAQNYPHVIAYQCADEITLGEALNLGLEITGGEYVQFVTAEDTLCPSTLTAHAATLDRYVHIAVSQSAFEVRLRSGRTAAQASFDRTLHLPSESALPHALLSASALSLLSSLMIRRTVLTGRGLRFDANLHWAAGYDLVLRLLESGDLAYRHEIGCVVDETTAAPRTAAERLRHFVETCAALRGAVGRTAFPADLLGRMAEQVAAAHQALQQTGLRGQTLGRILAGASLGGPAGDNAATAALLGLLEDVRLSLTGAQHPMRRAA